MFEAPHAKTTGTSQVPQTKPVSPVVRKIVFLIWAGAHMYSRQTQSRQGFKVAEPLQPNQLQPLRFRQAVRQAGRLRFLRRTYTPQDRVLNSWAGRSRSRTTGSCSLNPKPAHPQGRATAAAEPAESLFLNIALWKEPQLFNELLVHG